MDMAIIYQASPIVPDFTISMYIWQFILPWGGDAISPEILPDNPTNFILYL